MARLVGQGIFDHGSQEERTVLFDVPKPTVCEQHTQVIVATARPVGCSAPETPMPIQATQQEP